MTSIQWMKSIYLHHRKMDDSPAVSIYKAIRAEFQFRKFQEQWGEDKE